MTDLPQASLLLMPTDNASSLATSGMTPSEPFDFATVSQTVLKLTNQEALQRIAVAPVVSGGTQAAMQRLVEIVEQLRSPGGGWPLDLVQTSENLTPYVVEEVHEVLHTLHPNSEPTLPATPLLGTDPLVHPFWQRYFAIADLIPRLLWFIARSSYDLMQLVGGVPAKVCLADGSRESGVLRFAAILEAKAAEIHWSLDLATNQAAQPELLPTTVVQADDGNFCKQPTPTAELLQTLTHQIQAATPAILPFLEQTEADLLAPGQDWQAGVVQLKLGLVFVRDEDGLAPGETAADLVADPAAFEPPAQSSIFEALIKLTDQVGQTYYRQSMIRQQMEYALPKLQPTLEQGAQALPLIVDTAYEIAEIMQHPVAWSEYNFLQPEVLSDEWLPKLLWHLTRSSYEVMQLVGGVTASVLQPGCDWQTGTLNLLARLKIQAEHTEWNLDLATGQRLPELPDILHQTVVIQSDQSDLCQKPDRVETLLEQVLTQIKTMAPLMTLLLTEVEADLLESEGDWQRAVLQLHLGLSFTPDVVSDRQFEFNE